MLCESLPADAADARKRPRPLPDAFFFLLKYLLYLRNLWGVFFLASYG